MTTTTSQSEATYRVMLKRVIRMTGNMSIPNDAPTDTLEAAFFAACQEMPDEAATMLNCMVERAARTWVEGNNSGDSAKFAQAEQDSERITDAFDRAMLSIGITTSWPGLYPTFDVGDRHYHGLRDALEAATQ